jgi:hypothetical protein
MNEEHKKYNEAELIVGGLIFFALDGICFALDWTGAGAFITPIIQSAGTFAMNVVALLKGDKNALKLGRQLVKYAINFLPFLPTLTTVFFIEAYIHNHPEKFALATKVMAAGSAALNVKKLKDIKEAKGSFAAAREAGRQFRGAMEKEWSAMTTEETAAVPAKFQKRRLNFAGVAPTRGSQNE